MRILNGTKVIDAEPGWREALLRGGRRVVIDLGAGDGRFAYESARNDAASVYVAVDPDAAALAEYAFRAGRLLSKIKGYFFLFEKIPEHSPNDNERQ